ncbi:MAG: hypothetical protein H7A46_16990 [Verrucomicrobiales bacterium]|nr:hypothetical protein [Verrucomicrobiales bacterium]
MKRTCLFLLLLLAGCGSVGRPLTGAALGAGGAYLGHRLSDGDPLATAGGAAAGILASEGAHALAAAQKDKAFVSGYNLGRSDGVKDLYWHLQDQQRAADAAPSYLFPEVTIPAHSENGVLLEPSTRTLRIQR